ncbi:MAG: hypothetical protein ACR2H3_00275 [Acidimicrobiales bacterium]
MRGLRLFDILHLLEHVATARERADDETWDRLSSILSAKQRQVLDELLLVDAAAGGSERFHVDDLLVDRISPDTSADLTEISGHWSPYRPWIASHLRSRSAA